MNDGQVFHGFLDKEITKYYQLRLLQRPRRVLNEDGQIIEIYDDPESTHIQKEVER
jgi:hypothetical protein